MLKRIRNGLSRLCGLLAWPWAWLADVLYVPAVPPPELALHSVHDGEITLTMQRDHPGLLALCAEIAEFYRKFGGANYISFTLWDGGCAKCYTVTVTPNMEGEKALHRVNAELRGRIVELEAKLAELGVSDAG